MKKIFAVFFVLSFMFIFYDSDEVHALTTDEVISGQINKGLLDGSNVDSTKTDLDPKIYDNNLQNYVLNAAVNGSVYFKNPQKIDYLFLKKSVLDTNNVYTKFDFYSLNGNLIHSFTDSSESNEIVQQVSLSGVSYVDINMIGTPSSGSVKLYYEVDFFEQEDLIAPSEIKLFQYTFDDKLNLEMNYSLPDDSDFSHLKIYKNSELLEDNYKLDNYKISGISPLESNQFRFVTVDNSGNESAGFIQTVVAPDGPDFVAPQNILDLKQKVTGNAIQFNYLLPTDDDFSHLQIYRNNELIIENHKINSFSDSELQYESNYNYVFKSVDTSGNVSEGVSISTVTGKEVDLIAPDVPTGLTVKNGNSALYVTWNPSPETDIEGYNLYINDVKYNGALIAGNSFTISNLENMKGYNIKVSAVDTSANESGRTAGVNGVPDEKAMPIVQVKNNLGAVATSTENWFSQLWLPLAFGVSIPLAFIIGSRVKSLFLA